MKMTQQVLRIMAGVLLALPVGIRAIENLQISVPCPDVVLAWPSVEGETYIVQHRATLDTNSAWETLTNALPAEVGTNWTWFVHSNQMICATNGGSGGGGGSAPPSPMSAKLQMEAELAGTAFPIGEAARQFLAKRRVYPPYPWDLQKRPPYPWELENRPPLPWEPGAMKPATKTAGIASGAGAEIESDGPLDSGGETNVVSGFYRVVREGVHLWGVTNDMVLSGVLEIPIELGTTNELRPGIQLFADGIALPVCQVAIPEAGFPVARWNTAFLRNGTCSLHTECSFLGTEDLMVGVTNSVTVDNGVSFTDFQALFGDQMWVYAELAVNDADVEIDMFADGEFIGTFYDSTSDGVISFVWDLTDGNNYVFTNETFRGEFYAAATGGNPRTNRPAIYDWYKEYGLPGDTFSVAWAITKVLPLASRVENLMLTGVINILASPAANDPYQLSPGNTYDGAAFRMTSGTKTNLLSYLADPSSRNFYFFGHGNARSFGDYSRALGGWLSQITAEEISDTLTNRFPSGRNYHPYRFVFLDSCQSANGPLSDGFGIARHQMPRAFYKDLLKVVARAFVGYMNPSIPLPTSANDHTFNADMLGQFFFKWREGQNLQQIVNEAKQHPYWPLDPSATIWGATNLFRYHQ